ncbi:ATP synthase F0 subunit C [Candidatus Magnetominusculus xianensis]|uniref:ATP synthase subunit c n=1 Tax=Candidatus Magnetominusculus xianensis TaxID=1748249 RepID=A0ABR5SEB5_9BACT|nr:ATP synthase F0 subunit C [Candidatus Magnetominusculus xianensis]KWT84103.1 ATP synthase F0 subunit C [Candidatus Magnetominusculus xianensis]MBF0402397.1 ATP synthase F0 subunit C [Nitrospirota bacterium]
MRKSVVVMLALALLIVSAPAAVVYASGDADMGKDSGTKAMAAIGALIGIGIAALGTGIGQGIGLSKACEGVARNPGASGKITTTLIVGLAMIESLCIYAFLLSLGVLINQKMFF